MSGSSLESAVASVLEAAREAFGKAAKSLAEVAPADENLDSNQVMPYDLAHLLAQFSAGASLLRSNMDKEQKLRASAIYLGECAANLSRAILGRHALFGMDAAEAESTLETLGRAAAVLRDPQLAVGIATESLDRALPDELQMVAEQFRRFGEKEIAPYAEEVHRKNLDVPEHVIKGLAELGAFGLSIPETYGGYAAEDEGSYLAMVVATEELSRASLGIGGSLITRPEILARAILAGGTEDQKKTWLPKLASGEWMAAVAVTEPDFGSDVANLRTTASEKEGGFLINGVKTWCTFAARANVLMLLARTNPDRAKGHKGLSVFVVEKPIADGKGFLINQADFAELPAGVAGGTLEGRPIDTIGYRGMHSYELSFSDWWVPAENLVGKEEGRDKGFYFQMAGFENGRLQTAARATGLMQAAFEAASGYAQSRKVFGKKLLDYQLTGYRLGTMNATLAAVRQMTYEVARRMGSGGARLEASLVKAFACRAAETLTRDAQQLHGGMGYAEEFPVSRYFVDARVLSIFEGADETLCIRVIGKGLARNPEIVSTLLEI
jgi:(2S)-methylsuccinyl-CoA dehydrogenase